MARMAQDQKAKKKKNVSPIAAGVIIAVVLALIVVVYMTLGKEKSGLDENDPQVIKMREQQKKAGGVKGIKARMEWLRSGRKKNTRRRGGALGEPKFPAGVAPER